VFACAIRSNSSTDPQWERKDAIRSMEAFICSGLVGVVPVLGRFGAAMFVRVAGICVGTGVACLVLSVIVTRVIGWIDRHPVVTAVMSLLLQVATKIP
jgi:hypothetical protein